MRLKVYNEANSKSVTIGKRTIRFNRKAGLISLSKAATETIGLKGGDKVVIINDEERPNDWYICKTDDENGFAVRAKAETGSADFNCTSVVKRVFETMDIHDMAVGYVVAPEPEKVDGMELYAIITKNPLNNK